MRKVGLLFAFLTGLFLGQVAFAHDIKLKIMGPECDKCVKAVKRELQKVKGVKMVSVKLLDAKKKIAEAVVEVEGNVDENALLKAVENAGFKAEVEKHMH